MNAAFIVCLVACIGFAVAIPWAIRNDNLAALENLDDDNLASQAADAWEQGEW